MIVGARTTPAVALVAVVTVFGQHMGHATTSVRDKTRLANASVVRISILVQVKIVLFLAALLSASTGRWVIAVVLRLQINALLVQWLS